MRSKTAFFPPEKGRGWARIGLLLDAPDMGGEEAAGSGKSLDLPTKYTRPLPSSNHFSYHQPPQVLWAHLLLNTHSQPFVGRRGPPTERMW